MSPLHQWFPGSHMSASETCKDIQIGKKYIVGNGDLQKTVTVVSVTEKSARVTDSEGKTYPIRLSIWNGIPVED